MRSRIKLGDDRERVRSCLCDDNAHIEEKRAELKYKIHSRKQDRKITYSYIERVLDIMIVRR